MQFEVWLGGSAEKSCEVQQMEIEVGVAAVHDLPSAAAPFPL